MKRISTRIMFMLLALVMLASLVPAVAVTAASTDELISYPIVINGGVFVGDTYPSKDIILPQSEEFYYCDGTCGIDEHYYNCCWYNDDESGSVATEFVNGNDYVFVITIHAADGYAFQALDDYADMVNITNVYWSWTTGDIIDNGKTVWVAFGYDNYQNQIEGDQNISTPILIDGSALTGSNPAATLNLEGTEEYGHCNGSCSAGSVYTSDVWFDYEGNIVTEFQAGESYFYQITLHALAGYAFNPYVEPTEIVNVIGVDWDYSTGGWYDDYTVYVEFHIQNYPADGIPVRYAAQLPEIIDGSELVGIDTPTGITTVPDSEQYYQCHGECSDHCYYMSNCWFDLNDEPVTEFVDGQEYYFQLSFHPTAGYYMYDANCLPVMLNGVKWHYIDYSTYDEMTYIEYHTTYSAENGIPAADYVSPIVIDGSSLAGITSPTPLQIPQADETFTYCDENCDCTFQSQYPSFIWYDDNDQPATEFVDGGIYYLQVAIHANDGYQYNIDFNNYYDRYIENSDIITVTGIDWDYTDTYLRVSDNLLYTEFYITYHESGVPGVKYLEPIVIDGSALNGITEPTALTNLPEGDGYYYCDGSCGRGDYFLSNCWYNAYDDSEATEFVDGDEYYYQIAIHLNEGYAVKDSDLESIISVTGVEWDSVDIYEHWGDSDFIYAEFHMTYEESKGIVGDINGNGKIDARDYLLLKRAYFGTYTLNCADEIADVNGNGKLDARDYLLLKRAYFGTYTIK